MSQWDSTTAMSRGELEDEVARLRLEVQQFEERWERFTYRAEDRNQETVHGCICLSPPPEKGADGKFLWNIKPDCQYHATALKYPFNHAIPWNCPTYWDGCNCRTTIAGLRAKA